MLNSLIFLLFIIVAILSLLLYVYRKTTTPQNVPKPSGGIPFFGHALEFEDTTKMLDVFLKYKNITGSVYYVDIGLKNFVVVSDYKLLEYVLSSPKLLKKSDDYDFFHTWLGLGLLTSDGPRWKKHRRMLTPSFHLQILDSFIPIFDKCGRKLIEKLKVHVNENSVDVYDFVTLCTLDVICETAMGTCINAQDAVSSDYVFSVKDMGRILMARTTSPIKSNNFLFKFTSEYQRQKRALDILHGHTNAVIQKRIEEKAKQAKNLEEVDNQTDIGIKPKKAFLDMLLETTIDGERLSPEDIREEVDTFMFEGHDTTSSAISFCLYCLAHNQDVQERAFNEQKDIFNNDKDPLILIADLNNMKYLEMVIKETLRIYPSVPFFGREITEDFEFNGMKFKKGNTFTLFPYGIHRDPQYYKDPEVFNPSRFETVTGKLPYAFIPFSAGPRNCIGQRFAMLEMKSVLSKLIKNFEFFPAIPDPGVVLSAETILKSKNGIHIRLKLRQ